MRNAAVDALGWDPLAHPTERVTQCNLCGSRAGAVVSHSDRYGFELPSICCLDCGLVYLETRPTVAEYGVFYERLYRPLVSAYHGRLIDATTIESEQLDYARGLARDLGPFLDGSHRRTLLDVGGSTGVVAAALASAHGLEATVLDPSPDELEKAASRGLATVAGTVETWSSDGRFDVVLLCQTVDHLIDPLGVLGKLRGVISDDGVLFVDIVDFRAAYLRSGAVEAATKVDHPYAFVLETARTLLKRTGFRVERILLASDRLHLGFVCAPADPIDVAAAPDVATTMIQEIRELQNRPA
jgi:SAM-dependent methyltransferase